LGSGFVLLCPHNNYLDPLYLFLALGEPIHRLTTHDVDGAPLSRRLFAALLAIRCDVSSISFGPAASWAYFPRVGGVGTARGHIQRSSNDCFYGEPCRCCRFGSTARIRPIRAGGGLAAIQ
jgi:hypothetical protein